VSTRCAKCRNEIGGEAVEKIHKPTGHKVLLCASHFAPPSAEELERERQRGIAHRLGILRASFAYNRDQRSPNFPRSGLRFGGTEWGHPKIANFFEVYKPFEMGSALVLGPTGSGKTTGIEAHAHAELARLEESVRAGGEHRMSFAYVTGFELSGCRRRSKIGDEAPLVVQAVDAALLYLDELGFEPPAPDGEIFFVLDARARRSAPTVVCSGLTLEGFDARYGGAFRRRLVERGALVNAHPKGQKGAVRSVGQL
jgi:hypothetical protein